MIPAFFMYIETMIRFFSIAFILLATMAWAHPHVFADVTVQAVFDESGLVGIQNHWEYDEVYGTSMFAAADVDKNGVLSENELMTMKGAILAPMAENNYYNYLLYKSDFLNAKGIKNFQAKTQNGKLVLDYLVRFDIPAASDYTFFVVVVTDPVNYISITADMEKSGAKAPDAMEVEYYDDSLEGLTMLASFRADLEGLFVRFKK